MGNIPFTQAIFFVFSDGRHPVHAHRATCLVLSLHKIFICITITENYIRNIYMEKIKYLVILTITLLTVDGYALSPEATEGKTLYPSCHVCHNPEMEKPLAPPMWGVQRRYKKNSLDKNDFVNSMAAFVKEPTLEKAIHDEALGQLGLMPALPMPDDMLKKIATYIFEENFLPPCTHWKIAVKNATSRGDVEHAAKDQRMLKRFCS